MIKIGTLFKSRYNILAETGKDDMGTAYLAIDTVLNKSLTIKEIYKSDTSDARYAKYKLTAKKETLCRLSHDNLQKVFDITEDANSIIVILEQVNGDALDTFLKKSGPLPPSLIIDWSKQLCNALQYLHSQENRIFGGTISPARIILKPDSNIVLTDFFIAEEQNAFIPSGEMPYKAPELMDGSETANAKTDIYSFGMVLLQLITNKKPQDATRICAANAAISPIPELDNIIKRCTQYASSDRYQSATELLTALEAPQCMGKRAKTRAMSYTIPHFTIPPSANNAAAVYPPPCSSVSRPNEDVLVLSKEPSGAKTSQKAPKGIKKSLFPFAKKERKSKSKIPPKGQGGFILDRSQPAVTEPSSQSVVENITQVQFSAIAPKNFTKGEYTIVDIYMYEDEYKDIVAQSRTDDKCKDTPTGYFEIVDKTSVSICLTSPDINIADNSETLTWCGKYLKFQFAVYLPEDYCKKQLLFNATVYFNNVIATKIKFVAKCSTSKEQKMKVLRDDVLSAFISYASQDRNRVALIIQGMRKSRPDMEIFFDVDNLRSGDDWQQTLMTEIKNRDVLYLCWSQFAKESKWVETEWRYALSDKGMEGIEPIPLDPPGICPPPPEELQSKHFNDRELYYQLTR